MRAALVAGAFAAWLAVSPAASEEPGHALYRAQLAAAEASMRLDESAMAREWLDAVEPKRRGFEWRVFDAQIDQSLAVWRLDSGSATALALDPEGRRLACGLSDGALEIRDVTDGRVLRRVERAHAEALTDARFDHTGARVVTTSFDRKVRVWDAATGKPLVEFGGHGFAVGGAAFSPDGGQIASCAYERPPGTVVGTVHLWNAADGTLLRTLQGGHKPLVDLEFSPDGRKVAATSWDFCLFVWDLDGGGEPVKLAVPDAGVYNAADGVAFSPDGTRIAAAARDGSAHVWDTRTGALTATLRGHTDAVSKLAFLPDGATLVTASADGTLRFWNASDGSAAGTARGHADDVADVVVSPRGDRVYTASLDGTVRAWDAQGGVYGGLAMKADAAQYVVRFSPDDRRLASCGFDGRAQIWSATTGRLLARWQAHAKESSCHMLDWSPDGRWLATGSYDKTVRLWDSVTLAEIARLEHDVPLLYMRVSPDGHRLASLGGDKVYVWDVPSHTRRVVFERHRKQVTSVAFSPDGALCVSVDRDGKALVWEAGTGDVRTSIALDDADLNDVLFSPDGGRLIIAARSGRVTAHPFPVGTPAREIARLRHASQRLVLTADGARLASAGNGVATLDPLRGGLLATFRPYRETAYGVDFDGRGARLASCSSDGTIAVSESTPLRERLAERASIEAAREAIAVVLAGRLDRGESIVALADWARGEKGLDDVRRAAWIELLTERAAATSLRARSMASADAPGDRSQRGAPRMCQAGSPHSSVDASGQAARQERADPASR